MFDQSMTSSHLAVRSSLRLAVEKALWIDAVSKKDSTSAILPLLTTDTSTHLHSKKAPETGFASLPKTVPPQLPLVISLFASSFTVK